MAFDVAQQKHYNNKYYTLTFKYINIDDFYFCATRILIFLFLPFLILWKAFGPFVFRNVCQNKTVRNLIEEIVFLMLMWGFKDKINKWMNNGASRSRCTIIQLREHPIFFRLVWHLILVVCVWLLGLRLQVFFFFFLREALVLSGIIS